MKARRRQVADALTRDGETAVLVEGTVILLSELSSAIYALCEHPIDVGTLAHELESRFGRPAGGSALEATQDVVAAMVAHKVLTTDEEPVTLG